MYCKVGYIPGGFIFAIIAICKWNANSTSRELLISYITHTVQVKNKLSDSEFKTPQISLNLKFEKI